MEFTVAVYPDLADLERWSATPAAAGPFADFAGHVKHRVLTERHPGETLEQFSGRVRAIEDAESLLPDWVEFLDQATFDWWNADDLIVPAPA